MTAIVSSLGLLVLGCVLLCQSMGSEGVAPCDVVQGFPYPRLKYRCEGSDIILMCTHTTEIKVMSTCYGGDRGICAPKAYSCYARYTEAKYFSCVNEKVATQCDGQMQCQFPVSKHIFGTPPYPDNKISLEVKFNCETRATSSSYLQKYHAYVCEGNYLTLDCPPSSGKSVEIRYAQYGRTQSNRCNPQVLGINKSNNTCSNDVTDSLKTLCKEKWHCHFKLTSDEFNVSNLCEGVYKYLEVQYYCQ